MARKYNVTNLVGRPIKYTTSDFRNIICKTKTDKEFAQMFNVSEGTIKGIRCNQSKILGIPIKDKWMNQNYNGNAIQRS